MVGDISIELINNLEYNPLKRERWQFHISSGNLYLNLYVFEERETKRHKFKPHYVNGKICKYGKFIRKGEGLSEYYVMSEIMTEKIFNQVIDKFKEEFNKCLEDIKTSHNTEYTNKKQ